MAHEVWTHHALQGLVPVADCFAGGVATDIISLANYNRALFTIITGAIEDANISNIVTVDACDDTTPSNTTAMAFYHRSQQWSATVDTWSAWTAATSSGYNFTSNNAVANAVHQITFTASEVEAAQAGYEFARVSIAETANKTITATVFVQLFEPRYGVSLPLDAQA